MSDQDAVILEPADCRKCHDQGFFKDPGCEKDTCAHGGRFLSPREIKRRREHEKKDAAHEKREAKPVPSRLPRRMPCPSRACSCPAGVTFRRELRAKARRQENLRDTNPARGG